VTPLSAPPPVRPGDRLWVIAPSSPFEIDRFERGISRLRERYEVVFDQTILARDGFLAGDDARRKRELEAALSDPATRAIVAVRGGYGAMRLLSALSLDAIVRARKWLVGFSDVTALHGLWARAGLQSIHGAMVAKLGDAPSTDFEAWCECLEGGPLPELHGETLRPGRASGRLFGGNLAVLAALVGTPHLPRAGGVLLLEDVGERPYRLDRMLTTLREARYFEGVSAVLVGELVDCGAGADGATAESVFADRLGDLGVPVIAGLPFGHGERNVPLRLGASVELDAGAGRVTFT
jgi:muramoyltetrapeptide carboxypeptidase